MAVTSPSIPTYTITSTGTTSRSVTVSWTGAVSGRHYLVSLRANGKTSTTVSTASLIGSGSSASVSVTFTDSALLTELNGASSLAWVATIEEWDSTLSNYFGIGTTPASALTISPRYTAVAHANAPYNLDVGGQISVSWTRPSTHSGWRARVQFHVNGTLAFTRQGYSGAGPLNFTPTAAEMAAMEAAMGGVSPRTMVVQLTTGWALASTNTYLSGGVVSSPQTNNLLNNFVVPPPPTGERYSKVLPYDGDFIDVDEAFFYNNGAWVTLGNSNGDNAGGREMYRYDGSSWIKVTLLPTTVLAYNTAVKVLGQQSTGETTGTFSTSSTALTLTSTNTPACGVITATTRRWWSAWNSPLAQMLDKTLGGASYGWAGTNLNIDNSEDWHTFEWTVPMWVERFRFATATTSLWNNTPIRVEVSYKLSNGTWTAEETATIPTNSYTASGTWSSNYFVLNKQTPNGYLGVRFRYLNNATYHGGAQSTRIGEVELWLGTITNVVVWA